MGYIDDMKLVDIAARYADEISAAIRTKKEKFGLTWRQIAAEVGVHPVTARKWGGGLVPEKRHLAALDSLKCLKNGHKKKIKKTSRRG